MAGKSQQALLLGQPLNPFERRHSIQVSDLAPDKQRRRACGQRGATVAERGRTRQANV